MFVSQKMLREPRLLVPAMQPLGPVKIDWSHPLTRKLKACYLGHQGLIYPKILIPANKKIEKNSIYSNAGAGYIPSLDESEATMVCRLYMPSNPGYDYDGPLHGFWASNTDNSFWGLTWNGYGGGGSGVLQLAAREDVISWAEEYDITVNSWKVISFPYNEHWTVYNQHNINWTVAYEGAANLPGGVQTLDGAYYSVPFSVDSRKGYNFGSGVNGLVSYCYIFSGLLSEKDRVALYRDPYQFLIPA